MSDEELERYHDWVQWLFPLPTRSAAVPGSPVLTDADIPLIRADARAVRTMRLAAARLIQFYTNTDHWLAGHDHNHLRITRIIRSLGLLVGTENARQFYDAIMDLHRRAGSPVNGQSLRYWKEALDG